MNENEILQADDSFGSVNFSNNVNASPGTAMTYILIEFISIHGTETRFYCTNVLYPAVDTVFINFIQIVWNPLVVPLITILIIGALVNGINSWWRRKLLSQEEDI